MDIIDMAGWTGAVAFGVFRAGISGEAPNARGLADWALRVGPREKLREWDHVGGGLWRGPNGRDPVGDL